MIARTSYSVTRNTTRNAKSSAFSLHIVSIMLIGIVVGVAILAAQYVSVVVSMLQSL